jgi:hypothetical protein
MHLQVVIYPFGIWIDSAVDVDRGTALARLTRSAGLDGGFPPSGRPSVIEPHRRLGQITQPPAWQPSERLDDSRPVEHVVECLIHPGECRNQCPFHPHSLLRTSSPGDRNCGSDVRLHSTSEGGRTAPDACQFQRYHSGPDGESWPTADSQRDRRAAGTARDSRRHPDRFLLMISTDRRPYCQAPIASIALSAIGQVSAGRSSSVTWIIDGGFPS